MPKTVTRLYKSFQPNHYDLAILINRTEMTFSGTVTITGRKTGRPSQRLTFHQKFLKITKATVSAKDKKGTRNIAIERINHHKSYDEVRLHSPEMLYPGEYTVTLSYEGNITTGMTGIYPCFFSSGGKDDALIATQFESHHAREAFPCIDEPEAKSTFDLSLTTEKGLTVLGNTPVKSKSDETGGLVTTTFQTTPRMSSYLLAFVLGNMHSKSAKTNRGTEVSVWATAAQPAAALDFAVDTAKRSIEFFEDYFGVPYPLAKSDHVALPDFSSGAMENWGLITYRERVLLAYPGETSQSTREQIATVIAHETSHQWFGNLVTMRWWDDLWLNESFANLMEYEAVDAMFPDWHVWDTFTAAEGLSALRRDATPGVQAVKTTVNHPEEISTLFDPSIVYAKGGRLLYMLKNYIGDEAFRKGLSQYFTAHAYKNTEGTDLWESLSAASGKDVAAFMNPWLERSGFPVISVDQSGGALQIKQDHFSDNPNAADPDRLWPVPLFSDDQAVPEILDSRSVSVPLDNGKLIRVNTGARGHYIVNYLSGDLRAAMVAEVDSGLLSNAERLMLLSDSSMLGRAGHQSYSDTLRLLEAYANESSDPVWDIMSMIIGETRRFIDQDTSLEQDIKLLIRKLIAKQYKRLGWHGAQIEDAADVKLRATIIGLGGYADDPAIIERCLEAFREYQNNPAAVSSEIRAIVFGVPVKQGDSQAYEYLINLHDTTHNSELKADISAALTVTRSKTQASQLLGRLKDSKLVKPQDADRWLVYLMRNRYVRDVAWQWMVDEWAWIEKTYSNDKSYDYMPRYAAGACNSRDWAKRFNEFFVPKQDQIVLKRNILMGIEEIDNRLKWLERDLPEVQKFFKQAKKA